MSSFIVSHNTMHLAIAGIFASGLAPRHWVDMHPDNLGMLLYDLNNQAMKHRYGDAPVKQDYLFYRAAPQPYAELKALNCLLYQCSEGDLDQSPTYEALDACAFGLMSKIINSNPQYQDAKWDS